MSALKLERTQLILCAPLALVIHVQQLISVNFFGCKWFSKDACKCVCWSMQSSYGLLWVTEIYLGADTQPPQISTHSADSILGKKKKISFEKKE